MADTRVPRSSSPMPASASAVSTTPASAWLTPERVAHAEFRSGFRGLDPTEVRAFLARVASELRGMQEREAELIAQLETVEDRNTAVVPAPLDIRQVSELLGQETARVLETAREAAADIKARAESDAAATRDAANAEADRLRTQARNVLAERSAEADEAAAAIVARAEEEAEKIRAASEAAAAARTEAAESKAAILAAEAADALAKAKAEGEANLLASREEGKRMVAEARAVRERILTDMARRRNVARQQLERVRAARERLLDAIDGVRQGVADVQAELSGSLVDAKLAGERGARTVDVDDIPSMRDLDAEVEMAKDTGLIDLTALVGRDDDLSVVDTGEFAAVTAPEPAVDRADEPTEALRVITPDADVDVDAVDPDANADPDTDTDADAGAEASAPAVTKLAPEATVFEAARVARNAAAAEAATRGELGGSAAVAPAEKEAPAPAPAPAPPARFGNIEVVPLKTTAAAAGVAKAEVGDVGEVADLGEATEPEDAVRSAESDHVVIDLRDDTDDAGNATPRNNGGGSPKATPDAPSGPAAGGEGGARRGSRRSKSPKKADELFARLRAADEDTNGSANGVKNGVASGSATGAPVPDLNGKGAAAVIGIALADRAEEQAGTELDIAEAAGDAVDRAEGGSAGSSGDTSSGTAGPAADGDRVALHKRDAVLGGTIRDLSRQLKLALSDQQNELLEAGRNTTVTTKGKDKDAPTVPGIEEMAAIYVAAAVDDLATAWSLGRRSIVPEDSVTAKAGDVSSHAAALGAAVVDNLRQRLDQRDSGADRDELWPVDRVRAAYREVRSQRLAEIVEYHVFSAYAAGQLAAAPAEAEARWVCDACGPDCLDNALAGSVAFGATFPTGHVAPPAFAGCRCTLVRAD